LAADLPAFLADPLGRRFLAFCICCCHLKTPRKSNSLGHGKFRHGCPISSVVMSACDPKRTCRLSHSKSAKGQKRTWRSRGTCLQPPATDEPISFCTSPISSRRRSLGHPLGAAAM
jgi:hypothetical protein